MGKANKHKLFNKEAAKAYGGSLKHFIKTIRVYNVAVEGARSKLRKVDYVKRLKKEMSKNIEKYELFLSSLAHVQS